MFNGYRASVFFHENEPLTHLSLLPANVPLQKNIKSAIGIQSHRSLILRCFLPTVRVLSDILLKEAYR
jgi:hypothetical protein